MNTRKGFIVVQTLQDDLDAGDPVAMMYAVDHPELDARTVRRYLRTADSRRLTNNPESAFIFATQKDASSAAARAVELELDAVGIHAKWSIEAQAA